MIYPWALITLGSYTWLRKHDTPTHRAAWSLFMALCIVVLFNPVRFFVIEGFSNSLRPPSAVLVDIVGTALIALLWGVLTKAFFRRATLGQVILMTSCGLAYEVWRTRTWLDIALQFKPRDRA